MRVVVVGAGVGGLALANGLRRAGIDVSVHERDASPLLRQQGYRLHLSEVGIDALARALGPERWTAFLATAHEPAPRFVRLDPALDVVEVQELRGNHLSVDRRSLCAALRAGVADTIGYGTRLTGFRTTTGGVTALSDDGAVARGDVLVGADGVDSAVRRRYLPHARVVGTGLVQLYGRMPVELADGMDNVFTAITGPGHRVVGVAATRDYATCSFSAPADDLPPGLRRMTQEGVKAAVGEMTRGWHPRVRRMIDEWRDVVALPLSTSVPIPPWPTTRVTLLGDAAHAMSPAAGAGANLALRDAAGPHRGARRRRPPRPGAAVLRTRDDQPRLRRGPHLRRQRRPRPRPGSAPRRLTARTVRSVGGQPAHDRAEQHVAPSPATLACRTMRSVASAPTDARRIAAQGEMAAG